MNAILKLLCKAILCVLTFEFFPRNVERNVMRSLLNLFSYFHFRTLPWMNVSDLRSIKNIIVCSTALYDFGSGALKTKPRCQQGQRCCSTASLKVETVQQTENHTSAAPPAWTPMTLWLDRCLLQSRKVGFTWDFYFLKIKCVQA